MLLRRRCYYHNGVDYTFVTVLDSGGKAEALRAVTLFVYTFGKK